MRRPVLRRLLLTRGRLHGEEVCLALLFRHLDWQKSQSGPATVNVGSTTGKGHRSSSGRGAGSRSKRRSRTGRRRPRVEPNLFTSSRAEVKQGDKGAYLGGRPISSQRLYPTCSCRRLTLNGQLLRRLGCRRRPGKRGRKPFERPRSGCLSFSRLTSTNSKVSPHNAVQGRSEREEGLKEKGQFEK